jgi:molybdopterin synthase sulfur carrier subunit
MTLIGPVINNKTITWYICWLHCLQYMEILLFGITRDITGQQKLVVPPAQQPNTVGDLKHWLGEQFPAMKQLSSLAIAVDSEYAEDSLAINSASEIALIPPVSGG